MKERAVYLVNESDILLISKMAAAFEDSVKAFIRRRGRQWDDVASLEEIEFWRMTSQLSDSERGDHELFDGGDGHA
jgi:hypothetical protein